MNKSTTSLALSDRVAAQKQPPFRVKHVVLLGFFGLLLFSVGPVFWVQKQCACPAAPPAQPLDSVLRHAQPPLSALDSDRTADGVSQNGTLSTRSDAGASTVRLSSLTLPSDGSNGLTPGVGAGPSTAGKHYRLVIGVITALNHFDLRNTWRKAIIEPNRERHPDVLVLFITGNQQCQDAKSYDCQSDASRRNSRLIRSVEAESAQHGDVVMVELIDVYRHLPQKLKLFYAWVVANVDFDYVMKIDDDAFVYIDNVMPQLETMPRQKLWWGKMRTNSGVSRQGKWAELEYTGTKYPWFAAGAGNVLSRDLVEWVGRNRDSLHNYQGEDVAMGIWLSAMGVNYTNNGRFHVYACRETIYTIAQAAKQRIEQYGANHVKCGRICSCQGSASDAPPVHKLPSSPVPAPRTRGDKSRQQQQQQHQQQHTPAAPPVAVGSEPAAASPPTVAGNAGKEAKGDSRGAPAQYVPEMPDEGKSGPLESASHDVPPPPPPAAPPTSRLDKLVDSFQSVWDARSRRVLVDLIAAVDSFLAYHELEYVLFGESLLGAVRHGGPVPWNDHNAIAMNKDDTPRLLLLKEKLAEAGLAMVQRPYGYLLCLTTEPRAHGGQAEFSWPFLDVFEFSVASFQSRTVTLGRIPRTPPPWNASTPYAAVQFQKRDFLPARRALFAGQPVLVPSKSVTIVASRFGREWATRCSAATYSHRAGAPIERPVKEAPCSQLELWHEFASPSSPFEDAAKEETLLIPRTIHKMWLQPYEPSDLVMRACSWLLASGGWSFKLWRKSNLTDLAAELTPLDDTTTPVGAPYYTPIDVFRILYRYGGVYLHTTQECIKAVDPARVANAYQLFGADPDQALRDVLRSAVGFSRGHFLLRSILLNPADAETMLRDYVRTLPTLLVLFDHFSTDNQDLYKEAAARPSAAVADRKPAAHDGQAPAAAKAKGDAPGPPPRGSSRPKQQQQQQQAEQHEPEGQRRQQQQAGEPQPETLPLQPQSGQQQSAPARGVERPSLRTVRGSAADKRPPQLDRKPSP